MTGRVSINLIAVLCRIAIRGIPLALLALLLGFLAPPSFSNLLLGLAGTSGVCAVIAIIALALRLALPESRMKAAREIQEIKANPDLLWRSLLKPTASEKNSHRE